MKNQVERNGIIYCRVSSLEQVDNTSLESQERNCREYAKREGVEIKSVFIEKGESAKTADRTEFKNAISYCANKKNKVNYFIVYKIDRFARNQEDHVTVQAGLKKLGISLRSATEAIDETPIGQMLEGVLSVFAEFDNNVRTERSKGGMRENLEKGIWQWNAPIGYYRPYKGSNIAPDPEYKDFIVTLFEEYSKGGYTYKSLATHLTNLGFKTKQNKPIFMQLVERILRNDLYYGRIKVWDIDVLGDFEPIVSRELYMRCQKGNKSNFTKASRNENNPNFPLRKIVVCSECGFSMTGSTTVKRNGVEYPYYHHHKQGCVKASSIPKQKFENIFTDYLNSITLDRKYEKIFKAIVLDVWQNNYKKMSEGNRKVNNEIDSLELDRQRVFDLHREKKYSDTEFQEQKEFINSRISQKRNLLQENYVEEFNMEEALSFCFSFVSDTAKTWNGLRESSFTDVLRFQKQIFNGNIIFNGEKFETKELTLLYKLKEGFDVNNSQLVSPLGIGPRSRA